MSRLSPVFKPIDSGGIAGMNTSSLEALRWCGLRANEEEWLGFKSSKVVRQFACAFKRIESETNR